MNKTLLITRPNHDLTTNYLYFWSEKIIEQAEKSKVGVVDLNGKRANKKEFSSIITKTQPNLIVLNGHGDESTVTGIDNEILVQVNDNEKLLHEKVTYAISCKSAGNLGLKAMGKTGAYIGYRDDFIFMFDSTKITRPLEDKTAQLFLEPSNQVVISLLKGNNAGQSCERSKEAIKRNIQKLLTSESPQGGKEAVPYLLWNLSHQVCLGNKSATI